MGNFIQKEEKKEEIKMSKAVDKLMENVKVNLKTSVFFVNEPTVAVETVFDH